MNREQLIDKGARALATAWGYPVAVVSLPTHAADDAAAVLDAVLPQIATVAELEALPDGTVLLADDGFTMRWKNRMVSPLHLLADHGLLTVVWQPS